ncbi:hypothetical protein [Flavobacterium yafengii]|uniref:hypothetical protein n=1 Tax=Flavobacterium yafengii TaxID=3041253 RepID=UPI0024A890DF|nr:hypothetical protein [Flavobacterium yafengii]MDI5888742.1 hypothetical protein [Flavobacterium yafengii]
MKKFTLLLTLFTVFAYSQDKFNGTTLEEYNYMTKGYKIQVSSGLDVKKGYVITDLVTNNFDTYTFDYKTFIRQKDGTLAGIILIATSKLWSNVYYLAIPVNNVDLLSDLNSQISIWDESMTTAYANSATLLNSVLLNLSWENDLKK